MTNTRINGLLAGAYFWMRDDDNQFSVIRWRHPTEKVSRSELTSIHPHLPLALDAIIDYSRDNDGGNNADGGLVRATRDILTLGGAHFQSVQNESVFFSSIHQVYGDDDNYPRVNLTGCLVTCATLEHEGAKIPYAIRDAWKTVSVWRVDVEEKFPGWEERLRLGVDIGVDEDTLMRHVFWNAATSSLSHTLPDVTFE